MQPQSNRACRGLRHQFDFSVSKKTPMRVCLDHMLIEWAVSVKVIQVWTSLHGLDVLVSDSIIIRNSFTCHMHCSSHCQTTDGIAGDAWWLTSIWKEQISIIYTHEHWLLQNFLVQTFFFLWNSSIPTTLHSNIQHPCSASGLFGSDICCISKWQNCSVGCVTPATHYFLCDNILWHYTVLQCPFAMQYTASTQCQWVFWP